jgi:hypothetical protein
MSLKAILWALHDAPVEDPREVLVLVAMADPTYDNGTRSAESTDTIARKARCSRSTAKRIIDRLEAGGLIRPGDQQAVAHLPANRRPRVYDLALEMRRDHSASLDPEPPDAGGQADPPEPPGGSNRGGRGVTAVTPNPSTNPTTTEPSVPHAARAATGELVLLEAPPAVVPVAARDDAQGLVARWIDRCNERPPERVVARVGRELRTLLGEGVAFDHVARGFYRWFVEGRDPSAIASFVNEEMNARPSEAAALRAASRPSFGAQRHAAGLALVEKLRREEAGE